MDFNFAEIGATIYRAVISLMVLFVITKLLGKKQVSQLTLFDYVIGISIGNFSAEMTINLDSSEINGIVAVLTFGFIAYLVSYLTMKSMAIRKFVTGPPSILIEDGKIIYKNLKKVHFDINDLLQECRINGFFDVSKINYALMEANGEVSILPKKDNSPLTVKDMNLKIKEDTLVSNVIIDTCIVKKNLEGLGITEEKIKKDLKIKGYNDFKNILLATIDGNGKINIFEKNNKGTKNTMN
ncbi:MAG: DUF421 domain-containing protein [Bacilli bacterium]